MGMLGTPGIGGFGDETPQHLIRFVAPLSCAGGIASQELEPRWLKNMPIGTTFAILGHGGNPWERSPLAFRAHAIHNMPKWRSGPAPDGT